jgi:hypothetical protein
MIDLEVRGGDDFLRASKALKAAGQFGLRRELHKQMRRGARPLIPLARAEARRVLPRAGGLAEQVAKAPMRVQVRTGAQTAGVRVVVGKDRSGARMANRGLIRHPVFGNRDRWVDQRVPPDWFDGAMRRNAPTVRPHILRAVQNVLTDIARGAR